MYSVQICICIRISIGICKNMYIYIDIRIYYNVHILYIYLVTEHGLAYVTWTWTTDLHGCQNADKKLSPVSLVFR
jgi:hypothetical protein